MPSLQGYSGEAPRRCSKISDVCVPATSASALRFSTTNDAQVVGVARGDVKDEVVGAGQEVDIHHLGLAPDLLNEVADLAASIGLQADRDHRLQRQPDRGRIDIGVETADHPQLLQPPDPAVTRRRGDADKLGQRAVGHPRIGMQGRSGCAGRRRRSRRAEHPSMAGPLPPPISSVLLAYPDDIEESSR